MTRSLTKYLLTPFKKPERVFRSARKLFKTTSLDYSSLLEFDLFSDPEDQFEEGVTEDIGEEETMNRSAKWPTYNWKENGYCNTGDLPRFIHEGNSIHYKDYEWYDTIKDNELKEEALINKKILEESMNVKKESSDDEFDEPKLMGDDNDDIGYLEDYLIQKDPPYYVNEDEERSKERRCKPLGVPYMKNGEVQGS
ncbi:hypothetical protein Tco_1064631 [Tanacetum coccineum]